ncbi:MAG: hypothetical protein KF775_19075 [Cyclobacteriaceae bacterium]|nr:hypothetical protein [Cyclobacteriaceae bacterium]
MNSRTGSGFFDTKDAKVVGLLASITDSLKKNLEVDPDFSLIEFEPTLEELTKYKATAKKKRR